jgi:hypothetical protein
MGERRAAVLAGRRTNAVLAPRRWLMTAVVAGCGLLRGTTPSLAASNEDCIRAEIPPKAADDIDCPENKIVVRCASPDCSEAEASGCGRSVRYKHAVLWWRRIGPKQSGSTNSPSGDQRPPKSPAYLEYWPAALPRPPVEPETSTATETPPAPIAPIAPAASPAPASPPASATFVPGAPQPTAFAIVVGIEHYPSLPAPTGARADAEQFAQVARQTLGVPASHLRVLLDGEASRARIERDLAWASASVPSGGRIYVYFSGHGAPDPVKGTSYLVPVDGDPQYLPNTSLPLDNVVQQLRSSKAKEVIMFTDACFSGSGGRSVLAPGARPIVRVKSVPTPGNIVLFSASGGAEISGPTSDGKAGLFSAYVLQGLGNGHADLNGDGQISLKELIDYVAPRVTREAAKANRAQHPVLRSGDKLPSSTEVLLVWGLEPT